MHSARRLAVGIALVGVVTLPAALRASAATTATNREILDAGELTSGDVPSGWTSQPQHITTVDKSLRGIALCRRIVAADLIAERVPNRTSPRFNNPSASVPSVTFANDQVYAFRNEHTAQLYLNIYKQTTTPACLQQGLLRAHTSRTAQVQVSVSEITNLAGIGNDEVGYALTEHVAEQGGEVTVVIDIATVRIGRAVVTFDVSNTDQALPQGLSAVTSVVDRLDNLTNA